MQEYINDLWEKLKTYSAIEVWIHVVCAIIVVSVLSLAIYTTVVKKIRSKDYRLRDKLAKSSKKS